MVPAKRKPNAKKEATAGETTGSRKSVKLQTNSYVVQGTIRASDGLPRWPVC
jgi:hypothetical protein